MDAAGLLRREENGIWMCTFIRSSTTDVETSVLGATNPAIVLESGGFRNSIKGRDIF